MSAPLLDLKAQYRTIKDRVDAAVLEVLESQYFILSPKVTELEKRVAAYSGCAYGVGVSSGTDSLLVSLMAEGVGSGDEVITTPYSFFATAGCISRLGARPVFVDIDPLSFNVNPALIERAVTPRTRAIIPVHLYGQVAEMDPIMEIATRHNLVVIEDAAQAVGAEYKGRRAGSIGHYGCLSFFPSKNLGGIGDGGMVVTNDAARAEKLSILRAHGSKPKYYHKIIGGNFRLDAIQAAALLVKLDYLDSWTKRRQANAEAYRKAFRDAGIAIEAGDLTCLREGCRAYPTCGLSGLKRVVLPPALPERRHIYNQFVIRTDRRDELRAFLKERDIGNEVYYPLPFHLQECFANLGYEAGDFPASECAANDSLAVPIYPELTRTMIAEVVEAVAAFHT